MSLVNQGSESKVRSNSHKTDNKCYRIVRDCAGKEETNNRFVIIYLQYHTPVVEQSHCTTRRFDKSTVAQGIMQYL